VILSFQLLFELRISLNQLIDCKSMDDVHLNELQRTVRERCALEMDTLRHEP
jgi:hypothetical protein